MKLLEWRTMSSEYIHKLHGNYLPLQINELRLLLALLILALVENGCQSNNNAMRGKNGY